MSDPQATEGARDSNPDAASDWEVFAALFRKAYSRLWLIASGIVNDQAFADDIVQEAALIALKKWRSFSPGTNFTAWMTAIVRNCAINYVRKRKNRRTTAADPFVLEKDCPSPEDKGHSLSGSWDIDSSLANRLDFYQSDFDDLVFRSLNDLSYTARCCLLLRVVHHLSYSEISELLEIPTGTAMSHVHRSKLALGNSLRQNSDMQR